VHAGPGPAGSAPAPVAYIVGDGISAKCAYGPLSTISKGCPKTPAGSITAVSTVTGKVIKTIRIPAGPAAAAITPDGKTLYLADSQGITPVDLAAGRAGPTISVGTSAAELLQIAHHRRREDGVCRQLRHEQRDPD